MHFIILDQCLGAYTCKNIYQKWLHLLLAPAFTFAMAKDPLNSQLRCSSVEERFC